MAPPRRWRGGREEGRLGLLDRVLEVPRVPRLYVDATCEARCGSADGRAAGPRLRTPIRKRRPMASARGLAPARADPGEAASRAQLGRIDLRRGRGWSSCSACSAPAVCWRSLTAGWKRPMAGGCSPASPARKWAIKKNHPNMHLMRSRQVVAKLRRSIVDGELRLC